MEIGFQDFIGDYRRLINKKLRRAYVNKNNDNDYLRKELKEKGEKVYKQFHRQTDYQKKLNKKPLHIWVLTIMVLKQLLYNRGWLVSRPYS